MEKAYPVYDQIYQDCVATIRQYLETFSNLQTIGRNGLHRYNNQDHSMLTGVYAAGNIMGEQHGRTIGLGRATGYRTLGIVGQIKPNLGNVTGFFRERVSAWNRV